MPEPAIIMAAPNGARKTSADHQNLPVTIEQTWREALHCHTAGASILHAHVRGDGGEHVLDPDRYRLLINALEREVPQMLVQVTTEAVGRYTPAEQAACVRALSPQMISLAVREMAGEGADLDHARAFYRWCKDHAVHVQHILYDAADLVRLYALMEQAVIPSIRHCGLFVLGRYLTDRESVPDDIDPFLDTMDQLGERGSMDWFVCAFGSNEQECALRAVELGGHARIGFENNLLRADGSVADSNAEQIAALRTAIMRAGRQVATSAEAASMLGIRANRVS